MVSKRRRQTPDQIIRMLAAGNKLLAGGTELDEVQAWVSSLGSTWHRWLAQYGGMKAARLKKLVAEAELDKAMLR